LRLHILETGKFKLDGGAMFGVVPKRMWNKLHAADENNLCTWQMRCLLVEEGDRKILIDTGLGQKQDEKFRLHFYPHEEIIFKDSLGAIGLSTDDITDVLLTHFHFDHVGGALVKDASGQIIPTFPNAKYWTNEIHYNWAYTPNARETASFLKENFVPLKDLGVLHYMDVQNGIHFSESITLDFVYGHTEAMMIPTIHLPSGNKIIYCADLIPSRHHVPLPYVMAYDMKPLESLKEKQWLHEVATDGRHFLFFEHDLDTACGQLIKNETGRTVYGHQVDLNDII
jgi:glyoxylase-like metal-dependent hydrolase (beta-lactamase superfamily II)